MVTNRRTEKVEDALYKCCRSNVALLELNILNTDFIHNLRKKEKKNKPAF